MAIAVLHDVEAQFANILAPLTKPEGIVEGICETARRVAAFCDDGGLAHLFDA